MGSLRERLGMAALRPGTVVQLNAKKEKDEIDKAFNAAFAQMAKSVVMGVGGAGGGAGGVSFGPMFKPGPTDSHVELAEKVLLKLIDQADSIICDPDDLSKRAWQIADAMMKQYEERLK